MSYVELRARSAFSFGDGVLTPEALVQAAKAKGYAALALTDAADLGGIIRFAQEAELQEIKPVVGAELMVGGYPLALLARDQAGYRNLSALVTRARVESRRGKPALRWAEVMERAARLHLLTGPPTGELATLVRAKRTAEAVRLLARWRELFSGNLAVEVQMHHVSTTEAALAGALIDVAERAGVSWVATNEPRYLDDSGRLVHDLMTALRAGVDVDTAARRGLLLPNGEWRLKSPVEMATLWRGREEGIEESARIADECGFDIRWLRPPLPNLGLPSGESADSYLRRLVEDGARERWGEKIGPEERDRIKKELDVIRELGFAGFFLVMRQAVDFARQQGIMCQGRGSAANSVVAFCLKITAVDPVKHHLLFERFLSVGRTDGETEAPDIDMDFEMHRREEVLNFIYQRHSRDQAAITAVTQVYHAPSALQDMMRALGYPVELAFKLSKRIHRDSPTTGAEMVEKELGKRFGLNTEDARGRALLRAMRTLEDVPRMRSTHPGGFVLSSEPLGEYMPIEQTTMGRTILQFDKDDLDAVVVPKFDFLGLGGLTAVRLSFDALEQRTGVKRDLYSLPQNDKKTFEMIRRGETLGTFQIESRAQIQSILQTQPENLYDLVVQVALVRPGPIQGEFVGPYTRRRRGLEKWDYDHKELEPILERTFGIPIFQEQAMRIAMDLGGYTATEADELRRTMGHVRKQPRLAAELQKLGERFLDKGLSRDLTERLLKQMAGFGNYGFPESHAWSFALIAYATAWLKANHPAEFLYGLLNAWPMGFYPLATLVHDARRSHVEVRGPCLRDGSWESTLEATGDSEKPAVRIGWRHIHGIGKRALERLRDASSDAPFASVEDVVRRARLSRAEALHLARAGAFEAFEPGRRRAAWEALRAAGDTLPLAPARHLPFDARELDGPELVFLDYLATGISVHGHPMEHLRPRLCAAGIRSSADLPNLANGAIVLVSGLVVARQHPQTAKGTVFVLLEDEWGFVNVIVPARMYERNRETVKFSQFLIVEGKFERQGAVMNVVGRGFRELRRPSISYRSHDFH
ncbi:MAG: error-prone DNA polymerase [Gemmatimonadetes bacterium]|nr:error-prone DNA polymerase [Gemmatimonadota bacterium]